MKAQVPYFDRGQSPTNDFHSRFFCTVWAVVSQPGCNGSPFLLCCPTPNKSHAHESWSQALLLGSLISDRHYHSPRDVTKKRERVCLCRTGLRKIAHCAWKGASAVYFSVRGEPLPLQRVAKVSSRECRASSLWVLFCFVF